MDQETADRIIQSAMAQLMEHFDTVRIVVTSHDGATGETKMRSQGDGNFYGQYGSVSAWLEAQEFVHLDSEE